MADSSWPPPSGLSTPTIPRNDAVFQISANVRIHAPAHVVYETIVHVAEYSKWNNFIPEVRIIKQPPLDPGLPLEQERQHSTDDFSHLRVGTIMHFMVIMDSAKPNKPTQTELQVTDMSTPEQPSEYIDQETRQKDPTYTADLSRIYRVSWKQHGGYASKGLKTERFHEIIVVGQDECELRTWEVYGGVLAYTVKWLYQKTLNEKFDLWGNDLKKYAEQKASKTVSS